LSFVRPKLCGITFAFGSNTDRFRMLDAKRCPKAVALGVVSLVGYRLEFFAGAADLDADENSTVPAVAWKLDPEDEHRLDLREGALLDPPSYVKKPLTARLSDGTALNGCVYIMSPKRRTDRPREPNDEYFGFLKAGYEQHGFALTPLLEARERACSGLHVGKYSS
jgi:hypothetical protein